MDINSQITAISGIGEVKAKYFANLGIFTVRDLLYHIPRGYQHRGRVIELDESEPSVTSPFVLTVCSTPKTARLRRNMSVTKFRAFDDSGEAEITFFNQNYLERIFTVGSAFRFFGKAEKKGKRYAISSPEYEVITEGKPLPDFVSVYPLTRGLNEKAISKAAAEALSVILPTLVDPMPQSILEKNMLCTRQYALSRVHFPTDNTSLTAALRRLCFDEMFTFALALSMSKKKMTERYAPSMSNTDITPFLAQLPYTLTGAQKRCCDEIIGDMSGDGSMRVQMNRILSGDVGSGKTVCAAAAIYVAVKNGYQAVMMVPTEILARQHFEDITGMLSPFGVKTALLLGSTSQKEKRLIYQGARDGSIDLIIGTHAVISDKLEFESLALTVTDEQHRFGVMQRATIKNKGIHSHTLVMSATPIPRTLALSIYGDLSMSRIDEMPKGRQRVDTFAVDEGYRERINTFIRKQVDAGGQVYIVCPAIEEAEGADEGEISLDSLDILESAEMRSFAPLKTATEYARELAEKTFPDYKIALLHGKMKPLEKDSVMSAFAAGEIDILVSTTVIEVGVNVPNANLMIVENAERFGLSQLHQLRGRVGRGQRKSYCVLFSDATSLTARARLNTMTTTYDGYEIAEQDLLQRGPGDFFSGICSDQFRQSGGFSFRLSELCNDQTLMERAFSAARECVAKGLSAELEAEARSAFALNENTIS